MVLEDSDYCFGACVEEAYLTCSLWGPEVKEEEGSRVLQCTWRHAPDPHEASPLKDSHHLLIAPQHKGQAFATWAPRGHSRDTTVATVEIPSLANEFQTLLKNSGAVYDVEEPMGKKKRCWSPKISPSETSSHQWHLSFLIVCVHAGLYETLWRWAWWPVEARRGYQRPWCWVTVSCELTNLSVGNHPQVLCKKTTCS